MSDAYVWVISTDLCDVKLSKMTLSVLDGICPNWRDQIYNKRYRNKRVMAARQFMQDLETSARTVNRILWTAGKPLLRVL